MNATYIANWKDAAANDDENRDDLAEILRLAEQPSSAPPSLSMLTIGGDGRFVGQGRFSLEK